MAGATSIFSSQFFAFWLIAFSLLLCLTTPVDPKAATALSVQKKETCWNEDYTWSRCCNEAHGVEGNMRCWDGFFTFAKCCNLSPWNDHDRFIPFFYTRIVIVILRSATSESNATCGRIPSRCYTTDNLVRRPSSLRLEQGARPDWNWVHAFQTQADVLWRPGYHAIRWLECFADKPPSFWRGRRFIEFAAGIGSAGVMAVLNGVKEAVLVDAGAGNGFIKRNAERNLSPMLAARVHPCELNWTQPFNQSLQQLASCSRGEPELIYDIILVAGMSCTDKWFGEDLLRILSSVSLPSTTTVFLMGAEAVHFDAEVDCMSKYFTYVRGFLDGGLTHFEDILLLEFRPRSEILNASIPTLTPASASFPRACRNVTF